MLARPRVMERNLRAAEKLARKNGGKLPNPWRMIQMGHGGLYRYIKRHPKAFSKFSFDQVLAVDRKRKTTFSVSVRDEHLATAEKLTKRHKRLPDFSWLNANGYSRLAAYIRAYPEVFKSLDKKKKKNV
jgi:hypothetical protein